MSQSSSSSSSAVPEGITKYFFDFNCLLWQYDTATGKSKYAWDTERQKKIDNQGVSLLKLVSDDQKTLIRELHDYFQKNHKNVHEHSAPFIYNRLEIANNITGLHLYCAPGTFSMLTKKRLAMNREIENQLTYDFYLNWLQQ